MQAEIKAREQANSDASAFPANRLVSSNKPLTLLQISRIMKKLRVVKPINGKYTLPIDSSRLDYIKAHPKTFKQLPDGNFEVI